MCQKLDFICFLHWENQNFRGKYSQIRKDNTVNIVENNAQAQKTLEIRRRRDIYLCRNN